MTPHDLTEARKRLRLTAAKLGRALELEGRDPGRTVRRWETGAVAIPGPARVAVRLMLEAQARQGLQDAMQNAMALMPPAGPVPYLDDERPAFVQPTKTRRRG